MESCGSSPALAFFRSYALYKLDKLDAALAALSEAGERAPAESASHLRAQILFRLARFDDCTGLYTSLLRELEKDAADAADVGDVRLNLAASMLGAGRSHELLADAAFRDVVKPLTLGHSLDGATNYEMMYNVACAFADAGQPGPAMRGLAAALACGEAALRDEGESPERIGEDMAIVRAQAGFLLQCSHFDEAALAIYAQVQACRPADASVSAAVTSNLAQLSSGRGLLEVYKRLRSAGSGASRFLARQTMALLFNRALLSYRVRRVDEADAAIADLRAALAAAEAKGASSADAGYARMLGSQTDVLEAALASLRPDAAAATASPSAARADALRRISSLAPGGSSSSSAGFLSPVLAVRAQLLIEDGAWKEAAAVLRPVFDASIAAPAAAPTIPALANTLSHVYMAAGLPKDAEAVMDAAVASAIAVARSAPAENKAVSAAASAATALHARAAFHISVGSSSAATADFTAISKLEGAPSESRAAALACIALRTLSGGSTTAERDAEKLVKDAAHMSASDAPLPLSSDPAFSPSALDELEWGVPHLRGEAAGGGSKGGAAATATTPTAAVATTTNARSVAAGAAARKRREKRRRERARDEFVAKLRASGKYDILGLPAPDPERWLKKRDRTHGRKGKRKQLAKMNVSTGGAQGVSAESEALAKSLDAKAKADAVAASGGSKASGAAGSPGGKSAPAPPASLPSSAGKRKGKK